MEKDDIYIFYSNTKTGLNALCSFTREQLMIQCVQCLKVVQYAVKF